MDLHPVAALKIDPIVDYDGALNAAQACGAGARLFALQEALVAARAANPARKAAWLRLAAELDTIRITRRRRKSGASRATETPRITDPVLPVAASKGAASQVAETSASQDDMSLRTNARKVCGTAAPGDLHVVKQAVRLGAVDPKLSAYMDSLDPRQPLNTARVAEMLVTVFGVSAASLAQNWVRQMEAERDMTAVLAWCKVAAAVGQLLAERLQSFVLAADPRERSARVQ